MSISRRKILIGAAGICASHAYAQVPLTGAGLTGPASSLDPATTAWIAAVVGAGGTVSGGRATLVNNLILSLKADTLFTKLDRLWLHAAENTQSALIDVIAASAATSHGTPTFTTDRGYTFNASTMYLDSGFNPATAGGAYALNSAHTSYYYRSLAGPDIPRGMVSCFDGSSFSENNLTGASPVQTTVGLLNDASALTPITVVPTGMIIWTRTASNARVFYSNGSAVSLGSDTAASTSIPSANLFIGARNNSGSPDQFGDQQQAASSIGSGLNATDAGNLTSIVNTYMTAIGANVF